MTLLCIKYFYLKIVYTIKGNKISLKMNIFASKNNSERLQIEGISKILSVQFFLKVAPRHEIKMPFCAARKRV